MKRLLIISLIIIGSLLTTSAQSFDEDDKAKKDSTIYQNIYEYSKQSRFNKLIYDIIFRSPKHETRDSTVTVQEICEFKDFENKIIRNIFITNEAPFEVDDSASVAKKNLSKTGNSLHINTQTFIVKGLLLFKENDMFDSLRIQESERLLRSQPYLQKSTITPVPVENCDSIDILIVVKDKFTIYPEAAISSSRFGLGLKEINLFGMGHQAHVNYMWNYPGVIHNFQYDYKIPNISKTFITTGFIYKNHKTDGNVTKHFYAERPFYSPLAKWAGGITVMQQAQKQDINIPNTNDFINQGFKYNVIDLWGAYAFNIKSKNTLKARTRKLVMSARYYHIDYPESPLPEYDPFNVYSRENIYLVSLGISRRSYQKDSYLFKFGFTEDVPIGYNFSIIGGIQNKNQLSRLYLAAKISMGKYYKPGYFSGAMQYGSFFNGFDIEEGVFTAELNYFTPLLEINGWRIRQFIKSQYMTGINRLDTDRLALEDYFGINGFNSRGVTGTQKFVTTFQTQVFTPWSFLGFKIAPYFIYSMGMLGDHDYGFRKSKVYSLFGLGFLIRNDFLVFSSFEVSISFYPHIPDHGYNIFKFNAYEASDFKFNDFDIKKPEQVVYR